jgi:hypothetical protein
MYMLLPHQQNVMQNHDIKIVNRFFENVTQFRYFGTTIRNQYFIQERIKKRLNSSNACYRLSSRVLCKNIKIRIYTTIIRLWFCMGVTLGL